MSQQFCKPIVDLMDSKGGFPNLENVRCFFAGFSFAIIIIQMGDRFIQAFLHLRLSKVLI